MEHTTLQAGIEAAQLGDLEGAYRLIRQAILEDSQYAPAWYYMSFLVPNLDRQRDYLEWALRLDPNYTEAREALEQLHIRQLLTSARSIVGPEYRKIGDYLVDLGLISTAQRDQALAELHQEQAKEQRRAVEESQTKRFGDILLQHRWLTPQQLATALVQQQQERSRSGQRPERLGEYLMVGELVTGDQLGVALAEQAQLRMHAKHTRLGELLVRSGSLVPSTLAHVLDQQQQDFASRYGNI